MPTQDNRAMLIFQQVMSTTSTLNMYISILAMCWFQQTMSTKHSTLITTPSIIHDQDYVFKKTVFANNAIFSKIMSQSKDFFWLIQPQIYPSTYLEMEELQLMLLEKQLTTKFLLFWGKKAIFPPKMVAPWKTL